jgi:glycosyltransferase involved in cell wall biosynthesis
VAQELAKAGEEVDVWAPECRVRQGSDPGVHLHRLPGHFGPRSLTILGSALSVANGDRILVQYVPHAFGYKAMNLPFCYWLYTRRSSNITVMFHEVAFQRRIMQPIRHNLLGEVTSLMAALVARSAQRVFVASQAWEERLRALVGNEKAIEWLPVPSNVPLACEPEATKVIKDRYATDGFLIGHFGTYGPKIRGYLEAALPQLLQDRRIRIILLGRGSNSFREALVCSIPAIAARLHATDELPEEDLSGHLSACDLMIQPYPDGISARRTSAMAALAHGRPVATTVGSLTEPLWMQSGAVATVPAGEAAKLAQLALTLLENHSERQRLALAGAALYRERFDLCHTISALRTTDADRDSKLVKP